MNAEKLFVHKLTTDPVLRKLRDFALRTDAPSYLVGGWVRDLFLNRPSKDLDVLVVGSGLEFARQFAAYLRVNDVQFFKNFGTARLMYEGQEIEFVGARTESYERGSRKPIVEAGTLDDDLRRRDFTINCFAISLQDLSFIDQFSGLQHLQDKIIDTPLDPSIAFQDDPLRILRAFRFSAQLDFHLAERVVQAIKEHSSRLQIISSERIVVELNKILMSANPGKIFEQMQECGVLEQFLPELSALDYVTTKDGKKHKNNFYHTCKVIQQTRELPIQDFETHLKMMWVAVLHDIGKKSTQQFSDEGWTFWHHEQVSARMLDNIFKKLKLPTQEWLPFVHSLVENHGRPKQLIGANDAGLRRLIVDMGDNLQPLLEFSKADITTKFEDKRQKLIQQVVELETKIQELIEKDNLRNFQVKCSGDVIMQHFNLKPSKLIGVMKQRAKDKILDGELINEEAQILQFLEHEFQL